MDMSVPYEAVVPSLDGAVLEVLARAGKPVTGRQVQRLSRRGSVPGIATVLERLTSSGIIHAERAGSSILYRANRDHLAWPAVETLMGMRKTLLTRLSDEIDQWPHRPDMAVLFGSAARGDGSTSSDVDILIVHPEDRPPSDDEIDSLRQHTLQWTGNHAQVVVVAAGKWRDMVADADPLAESIARDGLDLLARSEAA